MGNGSTASPPRRHVSPSQRHEGTDGVGHCQEPQGTSIGPRIFTGRETDDLPDQGHHEDDDKRPDEVHTKATDEHRQKTGARLQIWAAQFRIRGTVGFDQFARAAQLGGNQTQNVHAAPASDNTKTYQMRGIHKEWSGSQGRPTKPWSAW